MGAVAVTMEDAISLWLYHIHPLTSAKNLEVCSIQHDGVSCIPEC